MYEIVRFPLRPSSGWGLSSFLVELAGEPFVLRGLAHLVGTYKMCNRTSNEIWPSVQQRISSTHKTQLRTDVDFNSTANENPYIYYCKTVFSGQYIRELCRYSPSTAEYIPIL